MAGRSFILENADSWRSCLEFLMSIRDKGIKFELIIKRYVARRSSAANRFYWGTVVKILSTYTGYTEAEVHDEILMRYVGSEIVEIFGRKKEVPRRRTTTNADRKHDVMRVDDFAGLITVGQQIAAELEVALPAQPREAA